MIAPASDVSQHISMAGTEASGTSNMKFAMNGGVLLATLDGATVEIRDAVGDSNMFVFGAQSHEVESIRHKTQTKQIKVRFFCNFYIICITFACYKSAGIDQS